MHMVDITSGPRVPRIRSSIAIHTQVICGIGTYTYVSVWRRQKGAAGRAGEMNGQAANFLVTIYK
jgi:hypothetical protein